MAENKNNSSPLKRRQLVDLDLDFAGTWANARRSVMTGDAVTNIGKELSKLDISKEEEKQAKKEDVVDPLKYQGTKLLDNITASMPETPLAGPGKIPQLGILEDKETIPPPNINPIAVTDRQINPAMEISFGEVMTAPTETTDQTSAGTWNPETNTYTGTAAELSPITTVSSILGGPPRLKNNSPFDRIKVGGSSIGLVGEAEGGDAYISNRQNAPDPNRMGMQSTYSGVDEAARRYNYKRSVWDKKMKPLDDINDSLIIEPTGVSSFDKSYMDIAQALKKEAFDLTQRIAAKEPGSQEELSNQKLLLAQKISNVKSQMAAAKDSIKTYATQRDNLSSSMPDTTFDLYESFLAGGKGLKLEYKDGDIMLVGNTDGGTEGIGQPISMPLSKITERNSPFRIRPIYNIEDNISKWVDGYAKVKTETETKYGFSKGTLAFEDWRNDAINAAKSMVPNREAAVSVLADTFGRDHEAQKQIKDPLTVARQLVVDRLEQETQKYTKVVDQQFVAGIADRNAPATQTQAKESAVDMRVRKKTEAVMQNVDNTGDLNNITNLKKLVGGNILSVIEKDGDVGVKIKGVKKLIRLPKDPAARRTALIKIMGGDATYIK